MASGTPLERPEQYAGREFLTDEELLQAETEADQRTNADRRPGAGTLADLRLEHNEFWFDKRQTILTRRTSLITEADRVLLVRSQREDRTLGERCIVSIAGGPPILALPGGINEQLLGHKWQFQIVQTVNYVAILMEYIQTVRIIPLDGRPHLPPSVRPWIGDSRGRWEGDTLVVETTNFSDQRLFLGLSAEHQRVVERITRRDADTLDYQFTIEDPTRWTKPWTAVVPVEKTDGLLYEFACHEGNYGLKNILTIARAQEKTTAEK